MLGFALISHVNQLIWLGSVSTCDRNKRCQVKNKIVRDVAEKLTLEQGHEYQSTKYRKALSYWLRRIRYELTHP